MNMSNYVPIQLTPQDWSAVFVYDQKITGGEDRTKWLQLWMTKHPAGYGRIAINCNGQVVGFGQIRDGMAMKRRK